jgi:hypothetical protein
VCVLWSLESGDGQVPTYMGKGREQFSRKNPGG